MKTKQRTDAAYTPDYLDELVSRHHYKPKTGIHDPAEELLHWLANTRLAIPEPRNPFLTPSLSGSAENALRCLKVQRTALPETQYIALTETLGRCSKTRYLGTYAKRMDDIDLLTLCINLLASPSPNTQSNATDASAKTNEKASNSSPCTVCGWIHPGEDMTVYQHPNGEPKYTFKPSTNGYKLLWHLHTGMAKGQPDVDCAAWPTKERAYAGDLQNCLKSKRQPSARCDLLAMHGNRRASIRKPGEKRKVAPKLGKNPSPAKNRQKNRK